MSRPIPRYTLDVARQSELMQLLDQDGAEQRAPPQSKFTSTFKHLYTRIETDGDDRVDDGGTEPLRSSKPGSMNHNSRKRNVLVKDLLQGPGEVSGGVQASGARPAHTASQNTLD